MWPTSSEFKAAVRQPHDLEIRADLLVGGVVEAVDVPFTSSPVNGDRSQFARRSVQTVSLLVPELIPRGVVGDLVTLGTEVRLWRGIGYPLPAPELVPQITGRITGWDTLYDENGDPAGVDVSLTDRCTTLAYERFDYPRAVTRTSAVSLIIEYVTEVFPHAPVDITAMNGYDVLVDAQTFSRERRDALLTLCLALGAELFADPLGGFVLQPVPGVDGKPVTTFAGGDGGNLVEGRSSGSDDGVYNGIRVTGQSQGGGQAPRSQVIKDLDPTSPTYWGGPFGKRIGFLDNVPVRTDAQADVSAAAALRNTVGAAKSVALTVTPDSSLQVGDLCGVEFDIEGDERPLYEQHLADRLAMPMDEQTPITLSTRATQNVVSEAA